jgi:hypothetical protein
MKLSHEKPPIRSLNSLPRIRLEPCKLAKNQGSKREERLTIPWQWQDDQAKPGGE